MTNTDVSRNLRSLVKHVYIINYQFSGSGIQRTVRPTHSAADTLAVQVLPGRGSLLNPELAVRPSDCPVAVSRTTLDMTLVTLRTEIPNFQDDSGVK